MEIIFDVLSKELTVTLALACKVCVAIFVFVTAYGMTKSINQEKLTSGKDLSLYAVKRYVKLMMGFWLVFLIS